MKAMYSEHELSTHIERRAATDPNYAIAYALLRLAKATESLATHVKYLGNGDAATAMGALEAFGLHLGNKLDELGDKLSRESE